MKAFYNDKFTYNHHYNAQLIELIVKQPSLYTPAISRLLCHTLNAQHIWNQRVLRTTSSYGVWDIYPIEDLARINLECHSDSLAAVESNDPGDVIAYTDTIGRSFENKVGDILFHIINHGTYHRGQIMTLIKAEGTAPLASDFIYYKR